MSQELNLKTGSSSPKDIEAGIVSSLADLLEAVQKASPPPSLPIQVSKGYTPPAGSQDFPHPRTIPDILLRSVFIQICIFFAYLLLMQTLQQQSFRRVRNFAADLPGPWWIWPLLNILLPELVIVQIVHWMAWAIWPIIAEIMGIDTSKFAQVRRYGLKPGGARSNVWTTLMKTLLLMFPLWYAGKSYKQRLSMTYHRSTYVSNLGIDHRNGWAVISGLICCMATLISLITYGFRQQSTSTGRRNRAGSQLADIAEEDEESGKNEHESGSIPLSRSPTTPRITATTSRDSIGSIFQHGDSLLPLVLTTIIHQIPLAATNRMPPLTAVFMSWWCLAVVPIILCSIYMLPRTQRIAFWKLLSSGQVMPVLITLGRTLFILLPWLLVVSTILVQFWTDLYELREVGIGVQHPWNFRWRQKDLFSHGDSDRVYMGG